MRFPAVLKLLHHTATRLAEACVAQRAALHEHLAPCGADGFCDLIGRGTGDALIALAVVVGTHVEIDMVVTIPPLDLFVGRIHHFARFVVIALGTMDSLLGVDLCQQPTARDHGVGLEQLERGIGAHLAGNHAQQVVLDTQHVDGRQLVILDDNVQSALEGLVLLALPVETHADGHCLERE